jgi:hypothetical protein
MEVAKHGQVGLAQLLWQRGEERDLATVAAGATAPGVTACDGVGTVVSERRYQLSPAPLASAACSVYSKAPASTWPPASVKALLVVCAVVVAPLSALTTSMPLPVVCAPRPPRLVTCTVVRPLALAPTPSSTRRSVALLLSPSAVPRRSVPLLPT